MSRVFARFLTLSFLMAFTLEVLSGVTLERKSHPNLLQVSVAHASDHGFEFLFEEYLETDESERHDFKVELNLIEFRFECSQRYASVFFSSFKSYLSFILKCTPNQSLQSLYRTWLI